MSAESGQHEHRDDHALEEHDGHRLGPRESAARDQIEGDDRVESHPGGEREGVVAGEPHHDREQARRQTRDGERRRERQTLAVESGDAGECEDDRVHEDDVGHHHERRESRAGLGREIGGTFPEAEVAGEEPGHVPGGSLHRAGRYR